MRTLHALGAAAVLLAVLSCRTPDRDEPRVADADSGRGTVSGVDDAARPAADAGEEGGFAITNRTGAVTLGLSGDRVYLQLSDSVRRQVRTSLANEPASADTASAGGVLGAFIERTVKKTVANALDQRLSRPLDDIEDVKYESGEIVFTYRGSSPIKFDNMKVDNEPVMRSFRPEDAERFVAAVREAKRAKGGA